MPTDERDPDGPDGPEDERAALNGVGSRDDERPSLVRQIRDLANTLRNTEIGELDLTEDGVRIYIKRQIAPPVMAPRAPAGRTMPRREVDEYAESEPEDAPDPGVAIAAPLTGVFYTASSPSTPDFTSVGETVQVGQVVCIVEAMKVFNEIKSEISGTVTAIVAQNGQLVQKGEALIRINPL
jgi:acetyl-CoA carboxylase biotin carboxyl carrier protein